YSQFFKHYKASHFSQKIQSTSNILDYETKEEQTSSDRFISQMFLEIRLVSSTDLLYKFYNKPELVSAYPLLFNLLKSIDDIEYVKCLSGIGQWMKHCYMQFSGKLTQKQHNETTVSSVINDRNNTKLKKHWNQFVKGWNRFSDRKLNIESTAMTVPTLSQNPTYVFLDHCTSRTDMPGRYIVAIVEMLQDINNNFLQSVHSHRRRSIKDEEKKTENNDNTM
ncbi:hypothetical protein RFI_36800, partial [Reticulomyxa filosa]